MKRRRLVLLVSACAILVIGLVIVVSGTVVARTQFGREQLRKFIEQQVATRIHGTLYLGRLSGGLLGGVTIDSLAIRDEQDSLFLSAGRVTVRYDPRDLMDRRIHLRGLEVEHPVVNLRQYENGDWNHKRIFRSDGPKGPRTPGRKFGDYVVVESARIRGGSFTLTLPWHPDDSLSGARRDSAVRFNLRRGDKEIVSYPVGDTVHYAHQYHWRGLNASLARVRLADPDSNRFGRLFVVDELAVAEHDPPFFFRNVRGSVRHLGDSIWINLPHFDLPGSTGTAAGKIVWGSGLPIRYDIGVRADSVSLLDVAWVYPTLPRTGGGSTSLRIRNDSANLHVIEYQLSNMDVRSTKSRLRGSMTFAVGGPVLAVRDVRLRADPLDFDLVRVFNGKPFPVDWQGRLSGTVTARGGPLNRFVVDSADVTWRDTHVPGAVSRFSGRGELDILFPAFTSFRGFDVDASRLDLRSIEYLFPNFPRLGGTIAGVARLDSSWLDVRFSDASVFHQDGEGTPSHLTGAGRVTWGEEFMSYDVDLEAHPLSLTMLSRSYPALRLGGLMSGPITARGTVADLELSTALTGDAGTFTFDGRLDAYPPGFAARGSGELGNVNLALLVDSLPVKSSALNGRYEIDASGDSLGNLDGSAALSLAASSFDGYAVAPSRARVRFADGRLVLDTARIATAAGTLVASGSLALAVRAEGRDSMVFHLAVDSLGGLRSYLGANGGGAAARDSMSGSLLVSGRIAGRLDSLDVSGSIFGSNLYLRGQKGRALLGRFELIDATRSRVGEVNLRVADALLAGRRVDTLGVLVRLAPDAQRFSIFGLARNGVKGLATGSVQHAGATTLVTVDTVDVAMRQARWSLASPTIARSDSLGLLIDSLVLTNGVGGRLLVGGSIPLAGRVAVRFSADSIPLADVGMLAQSDGAAAGHVFLSGTIAGTRDRPEIAITSRAANVRMGDVSVERVASRGNYRDGHFDASLDLFRQGVSAVRATASLPLDLRLFSLALPDDSLRVRVLADSADLGLVEAFVPTLQRGVGKLSAQLDIGGTWKHKTYGGRLAVSNGSLFVKNLGIELKGIDGVASVVQGGKRDVLDIRLRAWSGSGPANAITFTGKVDFTDRKNLGFENLVLTARDFHAMDRRDIATFDVSTGSGGLVLNGRMSAATLRGGARVDRGTIYLPDRELLRKQLVELDEAGLRAISDSNSQHALSLRPNASTDFVSRLKLEGVQIGLGDDVWLRSREANVKLSGSLNVRTANVTLAGRERNAEELIGRGSSRQRQGTAGLALEGTINADRGTYTLDLGPVQRTFNVQRGTITFQGTTDFNPMVDITALYTVKRPQRQDLGILVRLHGPFYPNPVIDLSSNESFEIAQSDLVSYLVAGQPAFQLTDQQQNQLQSVAMALLPNASSFLAEKLREQVGSWVDVVQLQWGAVNDQALSPGQTAFSTVLSGTRVGGEKQISDNLFLSASAGLCPFVPNNQSDESLYNTLGLKAEYRFNPSLSLQAGLEPSASARLCGQGTMRSLVPSPRQWGLSLFRTWHF